MSWTQNDWDEYFNEIEPELPERLERGFMLDVARESPYPNLNLSNIYILIEIQELEEDEGVMFFKVLTFDEWMLTDIDQQHSVARRYNCTYFVPHGHTKTRKKPAEYICCNCGKKLSPYNAVGLTEKNDKGEAVNNIYCVHCSEEAEIRRCGICNEVKRGVHFYNDIHYCVCDTCSMKHLKLVDCPCCHKRRLKLVGYNPFFKEDKMRDRLCMRCSNIDFEEMLMNFNEKTKKVQDSLGNEVLVRDMKITDIKWYIKENNIRERTFGVELECSSKTTRIEALNNIRKELNHIKVGKHKLSEFLIAKYDGSLDNRGIEFNTIVLAGNEGKKCLIKLIKVISKYCYVNDKCGLHIHIGMEDYKQTDLAKLYYFYERFQRLFKFYVNQKRIKNHYCKSLPKVSKHELLDGNIYPNDRYRAVNFHAYREFKTIELRIMEGTLDTDKIINWINIHTKIVDSVKNDNTLLLADWKLPDKTKHIIGTELYKDLKNKMAVFNEKHPTEKQLQKRYMNLMNFMYKEDK